VGFVVRRVPEDLDGVTSARRFEGSGNRVVVAIEEAVPAGFVLASVVCDGEAVVDLDQHRVTVVLDAGEHLVCRFTNLDVDLDDDGLLDAAEALFGTDPLVADTDGGGVPDGEELFIDATDPLDPSDDGGAADAADEPPPRGFLPAVSHEGFSLTKYGGGSVRELLADLEAAGATSATFTLTDGRSVTLVVTELEFVLAPFLAAFFGVDAAASAAADLDVASLLERQISPCTLLFVRGQR
jgi:hypothetical protein